jgi:hypothetical protein
MRVRFLLILAGLLLSWQTCAVFAYAGQNWTEVIAEQNISINHSLQNFTVYYTTNCTASYILVMTSTVPPSNMSLLAMKAEQPVENATVAIHKYQNTTFPASVNGTTNSNGVMKFVTGLGTAWVNVSKEGYNSFFGSTNITHLPPCRQFTIMLDYDCTTKNATITVKEKGVGIENIEVQASPFKIANKTNKEGKVIFQAYPVEWVFVNIKDEEDSQFAAFEIAECANQTEDKKNQTNQSDNNTFTLPTNTVTLNKKTEDGAKDIDTITIVLVLLIITTVLFVLIKINKTKRVEATKIDDKKSAKQIVKKTKKNTKRILGCMVIIGLIFVLMGCISQQEYAQANDTKTQKCIDSDNGTDITVAGSVYDGNSTNYDNCKDVENVSEYICLNNKPQTVMVSCEKGYKCIQGICVKSNDTANQSTPLQNETKQNKSTGDISNTTYNQNTTIINQTTTNVTKNQTNQSKYTSTCKGPTKADFFKKNSTEFEGKTYTDECITISTLKDYYCANGKVTSENHDCAPEYECKFGACNPVTINCTDKDNGNDTETMAQIIVIKSITKITDEFDSCFDAGAVKEWYCDENGSAQYTMIECGSGKKCFDGRCVRSICTETDGGFNIYLNGTVTKRGESTTESDSDTCPSSDSVREYYCYGDTYLTKIVQCPTNTTCKEGACTPK